MTPEITDLWYRCVIFNFAVSQRIINMLKLHIIVAAMLPHSAECCQVHGKTGIRTIRLCLTKVVSKVNSRPYEVEAHPFILRPIY